MNVKDGKAVLNGRARRVHVQLVPFDSQKQISVQYTKVQYSTSTLFGPFLSLFGISTIQPIVSP